MKNTQQHTIDRVTEKIPAPEIVFRNKKSLRRRPSGLRRAVVIITSGVAAAIVVSLWALLDTPSNAPLPTAPITAHKPDTPTTDTLTAQPVAPTPPVSAPQSTPVQPQKAKKQITPATKPAAKQEIAQTLPPAPPQPPVEPQTEEPKTQTSTPLEPAQINAPSPLVKPVVITTPKEKSHLGQLIADIQETPKRATHMSARKLDKETFRNPNLVAFAEGLHDAPAKSHLAELFTKKKK